MTWFDRLKSLLRGNVAAAPASEQVEAEAQRSADAPVADDEDNTVPAAVEVATALLPNLEEPKSAAEPAPASASEPVPMPEPVPEQPRNLELEAKIRQNLLDPAPYLVYADWLSKREHPRGELIVLEHELHQCRDLERREALKRRRGELAQANLHAFDPDGVSYQPLYHLSFIRWASIWKKPDPEAFRAFLEHPATVFLSTLRFDYYGADQAALRDVLEEADRTDIELLFDEYAGGVPEAVATPLVCTIELADRQSSDFVDGLLVVHDEPWMYPGGYDYTLRARFRSPALETEVWRGNAEAMTEERLGDEQIAAELTLRKVVDGTLRVEVWLRFSAVSDASTQTFWLAGETELDGLTGEAKLVLLPSSVDTRGAFFATSEPPFTHTATDDAPARGSEGPSLLDVAAPYASACVFPNIGVLRQGQLHLANGQVHRDLAPELGSDVIGRDTLAVSRALLPENRRPGQVSTGSRLSVWAVSPDGIERAGQLEVEGYIDLNEQVGIGRGGAYIVLYLYPDQKLLCCERSGAQRWCVPLETPPSSLACEADFIHVLIGHSATRFDVLTGSEVAGRRQHGFPRFELRHYGAGPVATNPASSISAWVHCASYEHDTTVISWLDDDSGRAGNVAVPGHGWAINDGYGLSRVLDDGRVLAVARSVWLLDPSDGSLQRLGEPGSYGRQLIVTRDGASGRHRLWSAGVGPWYLEFD